MRTGSADLLYVKTNMDTRLFEAALIGDTNLLHHLLKENPLILDKTSLFSTQNPLHIASISGHLDFVKEILQLKPNFAFEFDEDGFTPLHMAAAVGKVEIVGEIMGIDQKLCRVKGRDEKTPLHAAAIKGKVSVIKEMVLGCVGSVEDVNFQGETALHLSVKNFQLEAIKELVKMLRQIKRTEALNMKDVQGNTVLHHATWQKQHQVIKLLLLDGTTNDSRLMEVNAINKSGLTALDLLLIFPSEAGDREIEEILRIAGAKRAQDIIVSAQDSTISNPSNQQTGQQQEDDLLEYFKFKKGRDSPSEARTALLVVASLVATATFQAGLSPPGGTWQDISSPSWESNSTSSQKRHEAGWSILGSYSGTAFIFYVLFNSVGFTVSLAVINILTCKFPLQFELQVCLTAMFFSYNTAMQVVAPESVRIPIILITSILAATMPKLVMFLKRPTYKLLELVRLIYTAALMQCRTD